MVRIVRGADRSPVAEVAKKHGVSGETICTWRRKFGGMNADDAK
jgi:putative transposase